MILKARSIREVIAFPKNRRAVCPLTRAPSLVKQSQLKELGLKVEKGSEASATEALGAVQGDMAGNGVEEPEKISTEQVKHVAKLARLRLSDPEVTAFQKDLNAILDYVETLNELDTRKVQPMSHVLPIKNVWRADAPRKSNKSRSILSNAPRKEKSYFRVPKILEG